MIKQEAMEIKTDAYTKFWLTSDFSTIGTQ